MTAGLRDLADRIGWRLGCEWGENWASFPHCHGQAQCWMHITSQKPWCRCRCPWCRLARLARR